MSVYTDHLIEIYHDISSAEKFQEIDFEISRLNDKKIVFTECHYLNGIPKVMYFVKINCIPIFASDDILEIVKYKSSHQL